MPFKTKGNANRIKLNIKNVINPYFIIFIISPTLYHSNKKTEVLHSYLKYWSIFVLFNSSPITIITSCPSGIS